MSPSPTDVGLRGNDSSDDVSGARIENPSGAPKTTASGKDIHSSERPRAESISRPGSAEPGLKGRPPPIATSLTPAVGPSNMPSGISVQELKQMTALRITHGQSCLHATGSSPGEEQEQGQSRTSSPQGRERDRETSLESGTSTTTNGRPLVRTPSSRTGGVGRQLLGDDVRHPRRHSVDSLLRASLAGDVPHTPSSSCSGSSRSGGGGQRSRQSSPQGRQSLAPQPPGTTTQAASSSPSAAAEPSSSSLSSSSSASSRTAAAASSSIGHGLTVQELKEMTKMRLARETFNIPVYGPSGSEGAEGARGGRAASPGVRGGGGGGRQRDGGRPLGGTLSLPLSPGNGDRPHRRTRRGGRRGRNRSPRPAQQVSPKPVKDRRRERTDGGYSSASPPPELRRGRSDPWTELNEVLPRSSSQPRTITGREQSVSSGGEGVGDGLADGVDKRDRGSCSAGGEPGGGGGGRGPKPCVHGFSSTFRAYGTSVGSPGASGIHGANAPPPPLPSDGFASHEQRAGRRPASLPLTSSSSAAGGRRALRSWHPRSAGIPAVPASGVSSAGGAPGMSSARGGGGIGVGGDRGPPPAEGSWLREVERRRTDSAGRGVYGGGGSGSKGTGSLRGRGGRGRDRERDRERGYDRGVPLDGGFPGQQFGGERRFAEEQAHYMDKLNASRGVVADMIGHERTTSMHGFDPLSAQQLASAPYHRMHRVNSESMAGASARRFAPPGAGDARYEAAIRYSNKHRAHALAQAGGGLGFNATRVGGGRARSLPQHHALRSNSGGDGGVRDSSGSGGGGGGDRALQQVYDHYNRRMQIGGSGNGWKGPSNGDDNRAEGRIVGGGPLVAGHHDSDSGGSLWDGRPSSLQQQYHPSHHDVSGRHDAGSAPHIGSAFSGGGSRLGSQDGASAGQSSGAEAAAAFMGVRTVSASSLTDGGRDEISYTVAESVLTPKNRGDRAEGGPGHWRGFQDVGGDVWAGFKSSSTSPFHAGGASTFRGGVNHQGQQSGSGGDGGGSGGGSGGVSGASSQMDARMAPGPGTRASRYGGQYEGDARPRSMDAGVRSHPHDVLDAANSIGGGNSASSASPSFGPFRGAASEGAHHDAEPVASASRGPFLHDSFVAAFGGDTGSSRGGSGGDGRFAPRVHPSLGVMAGTSFGAAAAAAATTATAAAAAATTASDGRISPPVSAQPGAEIAAGSTNALGTGLTLQLDLGDCPDGSRPRHRRGIHVGGRGRGAGGAAFYHAGAASDGALSVHDMDAKFFDFGLAEKEGYGGGGGSKGGGGSAGSERFSGLGGVAHGEGVNAAASPTLSSGLERVSAPRLDMSMLSFEQTGNDADEILGHRLSRSLSSTPVGWDCVGGRHPGTIGSSRSNSMHNSPLSHASPAGETPVFTTMTNTERKKAANDGGGGSGGSGAHAESVPGAINALGANEVNNLLGVH